MKKENSIYDAYDWGGNLFEDLLTDAADSPVEQELTEEERRLVIFKKALQEQKGLTWVENALSEGKLRALYLRTPEEFILAHCLACNDDPNAYRHYDYEAFLKLRNELQPETKEITIPTDQIGKQTAITFGNLREYLLLTSKGGGADGKTATDTITLAIEQEMNGLLLSDSNAEAAFKKMFAEHAKSLRDASQSVRFYLAKYIYYFICHQIIELKTLLTEFSGLKAEEYLNRVKDRPHSLHRWSLETGMLRAIREKEEKALEEKGAEKKQLSKVLLSTVLTNFVLRGAAADGKDHFPVLNPTDQLSLLKNCTALFLGGTKKDKHDRLCETVKNLRISDFYGYAINFNKLYRLLFEFLSFGDQLPNETKTEKKDHRQKYITNILNGRYDMSRSAVLMYLASVKGTLFMIEDLLQDDTLPFDRDAVLHLTRVNHMLERMGYVYVGDNVASDSDSAIDDLYYEVFTLETEKVAALDALSDEISDMIENEGYNPIPFEIAAISAKERRKQIVKEKQ